MSKQQLRILRVAPFIALLFLGLLAFAVARAGGFRQSAKDHPPQILVSTATASLATEVRGPVQNVRFTVYDSGIYPRRLRAKPGVVAIVLEDHTRRRPGLVVERETVTGGLLVGGITFLLNQA